jgi:hypothetical protein
MLYVNGTLLLKMVLNKQTLCKHSSYTRIKHHKVALSITDIQQHKVALSTSDIQHIVALSTTYIQHMVVAISFIGGGSRENH